MALPIFMDIYSILLRIRKKLRNRNHKFAFKKTVCGKNIASLNEIALTIFG